jgi:alanine dehydrogenase
VARLAGRGPHEAMLADPHLLNGFNVRRGRPTHAAVVEAQGRDYTEPAKALGA